MSTSGPQKLTPNYHATMKEKPKNKILVPVSRRPLAVVPVGLLRGVSVRVRPSGFLYATCKDFATLSRLVASVLFQIGGRGEISRSGNFGYWATIQRAPNTEIVIEG